MGKKRLAVVKERPAQQKETTEAVEPEQIPEDSMLPIKSLFTIPEVAAYFCVDDSTIRRWIEHRKLPAEKPGGVIRVSRIEILKFRASSRLVL